LAQLVALQIISTPGVNRACNPPRTGHETPLSKSMASQAKEHSLSLSPPIRAIAPALSAKLLMWRSLPFQNLRHPVAIFAKCVTAY